MATNGTIVQNMQNGFQKPEIILAYTARTGSRVGKKRKRMREERLDLEWQRLLCLSVTTAAATQKYYTFSETHSVVACIQSVCVCVGVFMRATPALPWLIISSCHSAGELLTPYLHAAVVPIQECMHGLELLIHSLCVCGCVCVCALVT